MLGWQKLSILVRASFRTHMLFIAVCAQRPTSAVKGSVSLASQNAPKRARLLWENADDSGDFVDLRAKLPKCAPTGSAAGDHERALKRTAFEKVLDYLCANERDIYACKSFLEKRQEMRRQGVDDSDTFLAKHFGTLNKLDDKFVVQQLLKLTNMSMSALESAKRYDENTPVHLLAYILGATPGMKMPEQLRSRAVCATFIKNRVEELKRDKLVTDRCVTSSGMVDWPTIGCYGFKWNEEGDKVIEIIHRCSGLAVKVPDHIELTREYHIVGNHLDMTAKVTNGLTPPNEFLPSSFFTKTQGPHTLKWYTAREKEVGDAAVVAQQQIVSLREQTAETSGGEVFASIKKEKSAKTAQSGREALERKKEEMGNRRRIPLKRSVSNPPAPLAEE